MNAPAPKKNLLSNHKQATRLFGELDRVARNVPRDDSDFPMFSGHDGLREDLNRAFSTMPQNCFIGDSPWFRGADRNEKAASLVDDGETLAPDFVMMKAAIAIGISVSTDDGDSNAVALFKEAAMAFEAADYLDSDDGMQKLSAAVAAPAFEDLRDPAPLPFHQKYAPEIGGAVIGALGGAGLKYVMSDPTKRKRGILRLLDAALAGGLAGGAAGHMYRKSNEPVVDEDAISQKAINNIRNLVNSHKSIVKDASGQPTRDSRGAVEYSYGPFTDSKLALRLDLIDKHRNDFKNILTNTPVPSSIQNGDVGKAMNPFAHYVGKTIDQTANVRDALRWHMDNTPGVKDNPAVRDSFRRAADHYAGVAGNFAKIGYAFNNYGFNPKDMPAHRFNSLGGYSNNEINTGIVGDLDKSAKWLSEMLPIIGNVDKQQADYLFELMKREKHIQ